MSKGGSQSIATEHPTNGNKTAESEPSKKRVNPIKRKQMEDRIHELEEQIGHAEAEVERLESALQNFVSAEESHRQSQELEQRKASHAAMVGEWEELSQVLESGE